MQLAVLNVTRVGQLVLKRVAHPRAVGFTRMVLDSSPTEMRHKFDAPTVPSFIS